MMILVAFTGNSRLTIKSLISALDHLLVGGSETNVTDIY